MKRLFRAGKTVAVALALGAGASVVPSAAAHADLAVCGTPPKPTISMTNVGVYESDTAKVRVSLSNKFCTNVKVNYRTANWTAFAPGDYTAIPFSTLVFLPGETIHFIPVTTKADNLNEPTELTSIQLSNPVNGTIANSLQGIIQILNGSEPPG